MMNRLLFQFSRRSSSLLPTTRPIPILTTTNVNRTYSSGVPLMRRKDIVRRHNTVGRFREPPFPLRDLHEQIESLIDDGNDHKAASRTLSDAVISGTSPMSSTCHCVLQSMCDAGLYEDAISLFNFLYKDEDSKLMPDIDDYNCLISAHIGSGRVDQALQVYLSIRHSIGRDDKAFSKGLFSPHFNYAPLIQALVVGNGISDAVQILCDMLAPNVCQIEPKAFNCIISGYLQLNDVESAYKLFNEFVKIVPERRGYHWGDGVVFATLMDHYFKNDTEKKAMELYQDFLELYQDFLGYGSPMTHTQLHIKKELNRSLEEI